MAKVSTTSISPATFPPMQSFSCSLGSSPGFIALSGLRFSSLQQSFQMFPFQSGCVCVLQPPIRRPAKELPKGKKSNCKILPNKFSFAQVDFVVTALLGMFWLAGSAAWANGLNGNPPCLIHKLQYFLVGLKNVCSGLSVAAMLCQEDLVIGL